MANNYLIGRQPIFDRDLKVYGYELLFRDGSWKNLDDEAEAYQATNQIIADTILEHGLQEVVGPHLAFFNFTALNLIEKTALLLPKERVALEIPESIAIDDDIVQAVKELAELGYMIALDDFNSDDERQPLLKYASLLKIDIRDKERGEIALLIEQTKRYSAKTVAKKVETYEEYNFMRSLDCDYFQGFFFRKPSVVPGKRVNIAQHSAVQLLAIIQKSEIDSDELREVISKDVGLSYKLLRYINSAYFSLPRNVESIQQAILYLGMKQMKLWATVLMLSTFSNKPSELLVISLMRAKTCEKLAQMAGEKDTEQFFLVGLMSTLDVLLDRPMHEVLESLPLSREVRNAILLKTGIEGEALQCVLNYEQWDMAPVRFGSLRPGEIRTAILESLAWANNLAQQVNRIE